MFGFDRRCPRCGGSRLWQSGRGWLRYATRVGCLYPLRCDHCQHRFWRFVYNPPPVVTRRPRSRTGLTPVKPDGSLDTPPVV